MNIKVYSKQIEDSYIEIIKKRSVLGVSYEANIFFNEGYNVNTKFDYFVCKHLLCHSSNILLFPFVDTIGEPDRYSEKDLIIIDIVQSDQDDDNLRIIFVDNKYLDVPYPKKCKIYSTKKIGNLCS